MYISFSEHRRLIKLLVDAAHRAPGAARATFLAGNVMRVAVTGADADNQHTPVLDPPPLVRIWTSGKYASWLEVPMISATAVEGDSRHD